MKTLFLIAISTGLLLAADPKPIPADRQEEISRSMLAVTQAQMGVIQAQASLDKATGQYRALLDKIQKEFGAEGCQLDINKVWHCPPSASDKK